MARADGSTRPERPWRLFAAPLFPRCSPIPPRSFSLSLPHSNSPLLCLFVCCSRRRTRPAAAGAAGAAVVGHAAGPYPPVARLSSQHSLVLHHGVVVVHPPTAGRHAPSPRQRVLEPHINQCPERRCTGCQCPLPEAAYFVVSGRAAARLACICAFLSFLDLPAFSCCLVIFGALPAAAAAFFLSAFDFLGLRDRRGGSGFRWWDGGLRGAGHGALHVAEVCARQPLGWACLVAHLLVFAGVDAPRDGGASCATTCAKNGRHCWGACAGGRELTQLTCWAGGAGTGAASAGKGLTVWWCAPAFVSTEERTIVVLSTRILATDSYGFIVVVK